MNITFEEEVAKCAKYLEHYIAQEHLQKNKKVCKVPCFELCKTHVPKYVSHAVLLRSVEVLFEKRNYSNCFVNSSQYCWADRWIRIEIPANLKDVIVKHVAVGVWIENA